MGKHLGLDRFLQFSLHYCFTTYIWTVWWYRIHLQCRRPRFNSRVGKIPWWRDRLPPPVLMGIPGGLDNKKSACNAGDVGSIPGLERFPGGRHGNPLQFLLPGESPWTEGPGGVQSMGSQRDGHDWAAKYSTSRFSELIRN